MSCLVHGVHIIHLVVFVLEISRFPICLLLPINPPASLLHFPICVDSEVIYLHDVLSVYSSASPVQLIWNISLEICVDELVLHTIDLY